MLMQFSEPEIIKHGDADPSHLLMDKNDINEKLDNNIYIYIHIRFKLCKTTGIIAGEGECGEGSTGEVELAGLGVD